MGGRAAAGGHVRILSLLFLSSERVVALFLSLGVWAVSQGDPMDNPFPVLPQGDDRPPAGTAAAASPLFLP